MLPGAQASASPSATAEPQPNGSPVPGAGDSDRASATPLAPLSPSASGTEPEVFARYLAAHPDLTFDQVRTAIGTRSYRDHIDFDASKAAFYEEVTSALRMTPEETALLRKQRVVSVDHGKPYTTGSMYYSIYTRDLPVLITSDSILLSLHRSYDTMPSQLELEVLSATFESTFDAAHGSIARQWSASPGQPGRTALQDVDLYVTVARNLLAGAGAPESERDYVREWDGKVIVPSKTGQDAAVLSILQKIARLQPDRPSSGTAMYGGSRIVDWSQFVPREHYTLLPQLRRYFRTMMWLGRADLGFHVTAPAAQSGSRADVARESRDAAALALVLRESGQLPRVLSASRVIDVLIGQSDSVSLAALAPPTPRARPSSNRLHHLQMPAQRRGQHWPSRTHLLLTLSSPSPLANHRQVHPRPAMMSPRDRRRAFRMDTGKCGFRALTSNPHTATSWAASAGSPSTPLGRASRSRSRTTAR